MMLTFAIVLTAVVLIGRHVSSRAAELQTANVAADAATTQHTVPVPTPGSSECAGNPTGKAVMVSISAQHMWACQGRSLANQTAVTTGASNAPHGVDDSTPLGTWHIYEKFRNLHLKGSDKNGPWDDYVQYWMPFDSAVGFHDAVWQTFPFGSPQYKTGGSHGCVQLPTAMAAWLYAWAPVGTKVVVKI